MQAGQRMVANDGYEVALFPMPNLRMSQDEGGDTSHQGTYNIDLLGWNQNGRVYNAPIYAPCSMRVVAYWNTYEGGHQVTFESIRPVHLANGQLDYLTITFGHDTFPPFTAIGTLVRQGQLCYHTGTYGNVSGDHTHTCCGQGRYEGFVTRATGHMDLKNRIHYWEAVYTNDTIISQGYNHNWIEYHGGIEPTPTPSINKKFPWVLYASKLRGDRK